MDGKDLVAAKQTAEDDACEQDQFPALERALYQQKQIYLSGVLLFPEIIKLFLRHNTFLSRIAKCDKLFTSSINHL